jgi:hypothetical protein
VSDVHGVEGAAKHANTLGSGREIRHCWILRMKFSFQAHFVEGKASYPCVA